ncbi:conserved repeat domain-containing protein [Nonomuraea solani]|uniref:Conserved repeat domain-containing protein n=1 Tax=Nonomuraea solani TaxID=1144553 RepID=A0A1H6CQD0_9ACTN|nr:DUF11 domain-containing protein [Nonomuraea solani]SEG74987.1 conserved repeat domain-containing protein [Nonomuraea solani]
MRYSLPKAASLALLAGALLLPAVPASATTVTNTAAVLDDPFSVFKVSVKAPKTAKAGGNLTYKISAVNTGPHSADAWFVGGEFPKGVDLKKIRYASSVAKTECFGEGRAFFCYAPKVLEKGDGVTLAFYTKLKKNAKGAQKATLGIISYDVQQGMEDMSKEELDRLGIPVNGYPKSVTTKVVR